MKQPRLEIVLQSTNRKDTLTFPVYSAELKTGRVRLKCESNDIPKVKELSNFCNHIHTTGCLVDPILTLAFDDHSRALIRFKL